MICLACYHLEGLAATLSTYLQREGVEPDMLDKVRSAMFHQFIPSIEKQQVYQELHELRRKLSLK